jgi:hypothetical protein
MVSGRRCLLSGTKYDLRSVFQIVALWFELSAEFEDVNAEMAKTASEVPSYKFIPLIYQLVRTPINETCFGGFLG